jgi:hypothetical protein
MSAADPMGDAWDALSDRERLLAVARHLCPEVVAIVRDQDTLIDALRPPAAIGAAFEAAVDDRATLASRSPAIEAFIATVRSRAGEPTCAASPGEPT